MRSMAWLIWAVVVAGCSVTQPLVERAQPSSREAPTAAIPTVGAERLPLTPFPTRAPVATMSADRMSSVADTETHTIQLYAQSVGAVASIESTFAHPPVADAPVAEQILVSQGSGFLYDDQGHIVTNAHVVSAQNEYLVRLGDSQPISATVIGRDTASDLAVLALHEAVDIAPLPLSSRTPEVGMWVMTIGNPLGLRNTMTLGTISGVGRSLMGERTETGFFRIPNIIQVDAAINPGSSGGVLLDRTGAVIGMTTAIQSESGSFEGVGYAIPVQSIERVVPDLIAVGSFAHPWLGIGMRNVPERDGGGVRVVNVAPASPAAQADLQADIDIIVAIDATPIRTSGDLDIVLSTKRVGETIMLTLQRDGQVVEQPLTLMARP